MTSEWYGQTRVSALTRNLATRADPRVCPDPQSGDEGRHSALPVRTSRDGI
jgi:hypothetical protein